MVESRGYSLTAVLGGSHHDGFSCRKGEILERTGSVVVALTLSCSMNVASSQIRDLTDGVPASQGGFLTTAPPRKPQQIGSLDLNIWYFVHQGYFSINFPL